MKIITALGAINKIYLMFTAVVSAILSYYTGIHTALLAFAVITLLDTLTRINADSQKTGLNFNPFKGYFWRQIKSKGLRDMLKKIFTEYGIYLIIAFVLDRWILDGMILLNYNDKGLTLPVVTLYLFCGIEIWSIGENIEEAGGVNLIKRVLHLLPEKVRNIFEK